MSDDARLGIADLERRLGVSRKTVDRWLKAGTFPEPHYIRESRRWWLKDVIEWEQREMDPTRHRKRQEREARIGTAKPAAAANEPQREPCRFCGDAHDCAVCRYMERKVTA